MQYVGAEPNERRASTVAANSGEEGEFQSMRNRNVLCGYRNIPPEIGNNKVYAFALAGEKDQGENSDSDLDHSDDQDK